MCDSRSEFNFVFAVLRLRLLQSEPVRYVDVRFRAALVHDSIPLNTALQHCWIAPVRRRVDRVSYEGKVSIYRSDPVVQALIIFCF